MPALAQEKSILLIHSQKFALAMALGAAPQSGERDAMIAHVERTGEHDGPVSFTAAQQQYVTCVLTTVAEVSPMLRADGRYDTFRLCFDDIVRRLQRGPE
jgi:hypothetical protein